MNVKQLLRRHRSTLSAIALVFAVIGIFWVVNAPALVGVSASKRALPVYCVQRDDKTVAISFDAAWGNEDTQMLIDILDQYGVNATFFVVGDWVDKYPESVRALADAGNEVMNHSTSHAHFSKLSHNEIIRDINLCNDKIEQITGVRPTLFRCPYGEYNDKVIATVRSLGMTPVQWSVDSLDWKGISAEEITENVVSKVESGSILLFHNDAEHTPEALPNVITVLKNQGYRFVRLTDLVLDGTCFIDSEGKQHPAAH